MVGGGTSISRMPIKPRSIRLLMVVLAAAFLAVAFAIRVLTSGDILDSSGSLAQRSGTLLYASMTYTAVVFLWPRMSPLPAGGIAIGFCWAVELFQLTGIPAALSARSLLARLALGVQFDWIDLAWYPVGVVPLVALHRLALAARLATARQEGRPSVRRGGR